MKKKIFKIVLTVIILISLCFLLCSCGFGGYDFVDTKYHFDKAIIKQPDGEVITVDIKKWSDSEGEQLTITAEDGTVYLVNSNNCELIAYH